MVQSVKNANSIQLLISEKGSVVNEATITLNIKFYVDCYAFCDAVYGTDICYLTYMNPGPMSWNQAYNFCVNKSITNGFILGRLAQFPTDNYWLTVQGTLVQGSYGYYLGLRTDVNAAYWWSTNSTFDIPLNYTPTGIPSMAGGGNLCVYIDKTISKLSTTLCNTVATRNIICEFQCKTYF